VFERNLQRRFGLLAVSEGGVGPAFREIEIAKNFSRGLQIVGAKFQHPCSQAKFNQILKAQFDAGRALRRQLTNSE
jgi:hypothetical protein